MVTGFGKKKAFHDGCGLSSAGRWEPERRTNRGGLWVVRLRSRLLQWLAKSLDVKRTVIELTLGRHETSPFSEALPKEGREIWKSELLSAGQTLGHEAEKEPMDKE
eukprot:7360443-Karenia_brevis.AAC.1